MLNKAFFTSCLQGKGLFFIAFVLLLDVLLLKSFLTGPTSLYHWHELMAKEKELTEELHALDKRRIQLSKEIRLLKTDPSYVEKVIRNRLNFVRQDEILYLFEDEPPASPKEGEKGSQLPASAGTGQ